MRSRAPPSCDFLAFVGLARRRPPPRESRTTTRSGMRRSMATTSLSSTLLRAISADELDQRRLGVALRQPHVDAVAQLQGPAALGDEDAGAESLDDLRRLARRSAEEALRRALAPSPTTSGRSAKLRSRSSSITRAVGGDDRDLAVVLPEREGLALDEGDEQRGSDRACGPSTSSTSGLAISRVARRGGVEEGQRVMLGDGERAEDLGVGQLVLALDGDRLDAEAEQVGAAIAAADDAVADGAPVAAALDAVEAGRAANRPTASAGPEPCSARNSGRSGSTERPIAAASSAARAPRAGLLASVAQQGLQAARERPDGGRRRAGRRRPARPSPIARKRPPPSIEPAHRTTGPHGPPVPAQATSRSCPGCVLTSRQTSSPVPPGVSSYRKSARLTPRQPSA